MQYIDDFQSCARTYATLLVYPGERHPDEITSLLGVSPSRTSVAGEASPSRVNGWFISSQGVIGSKDSRRHIDWLLDQISAVENRFKELLSHDGVRAEVRCFWESRSGNGGPIISPAQMSRLVQLDLSVSWDVWLDPSA